MYVLLLLVALAVWVIAMFNGLIVLRNRVDEAASDIDVQLKRRHDLIPNLINTVKGYASHETQLFERVTNARSAAVAAGNDMNARAEAENMLSGTLRSLFAVAENYPALQANQNFLALQQELSDTENKIMASRRFYNANVRDYNIRRETFPTNLLADYFKFGKRDLFELDDMAEKAVPQVDFTAPAAPATPMAAAPAQAPEAAHQPEVSAPAPAMTEEPTPVEHQSVEHSAPAPDTAENTETDRPENTQQ